MTITPLPTGAAPPQGYVPTHPGLLEVIWGEGNYSSYIVPHRRFEKGEVVCKIEGTTPGPKRYSSVQVSEDKHIELNSDLLYVNHSCSPNLAFSVTGPPSEWHVRALRRVERGELLSFFYPASEWEMEQPFDCLCRSKNCLGRIRGAKDLTEAQLLERAFVNQHILDLKAKQAAERKENVGANGAAAKEVEVQ